MMLGRKFCESLQVRVFYVRAYAGRALKQA